MLKIFQTTEDKSLLNNLTKKQECIPLGCVPAARWPYAWVNFGGGGIPKNIKNQYKKKIKKKIKKLKKIKKKN